MAEKDGVAMLSMIAAAAETGSLDDSFCNDASSPKLHNAGRMPSSNASPDAPRADRSSNSSPRPKLILPDMTPEVRKDLESGRGSSADLPLSISKRPEWADYRLKDIAQPHPNDVLCGRGGGSNNHPGNEAFRVLVNEVKLPYVNCPKREKPLIARRIVEAVRNQSPPGRFLQKDAKTGLWSDIGDGKAREKTSQALREGAPNIRGMKTDADVGRYSNELGPVSKGKKKTEKGSGTSPSDERHRAANARGFEMTQDAMPPTLNAYAGHPNQPQSVMSSQVMADRSCSMPPHKRFHSEHEFPSNHMPWQMQHRNEIPSYHPPPHHEQMEARFPASVLPHLNHNSSMPVPQHHRRATMEYHSSHMRFPAPDSVPYETVRRLLLGQLDPVQLAYQILSPEDAAAVARRQFVNNNPSMANTEVLRVRDPPSNPAENNTATCPLPLCSLVSDGSSSLTDSQSLKEESPSSDESSRQYNSERAKAVLPKKKRKFVGDCI